MIHEAGIKLSIKKNSDANECKKEYKVFLVIDYVRLTLSCTAYVSCIVQNHSLLA